MSKNSTTFTLPFLVLTVLFCVCLIVANLVEIKTVALGPLTITAGMVVFPVSYIINDCLVEVYGFKKARLVIWLGFMMNLFVTLMLQLAIILPGAESWGGQEAMQAVYGNVPRILAGSFLAFICGSIVNAWVMSRMKVASGGRNFSLRAIVSTLWGEGTDSIIFFPIAFGGILPWTDIAHLIVVQALMKTLYEVLILPVTIVLVKRLKRIESLDTYDEGVTFSLW
ncbi:MAG: queuosine precursor transporter [Muribaculum sp.]